MVECKNVSVTLNRRTLLSDVSFMIKTGELTVIIGKNGGGKTTLLRAISGNVPYSGKILLDGNDLAAMKLSQRAKHMAVMPQILPRPPVSVRRLVSFGRQPYTGMSGTLTQDALKIIDRTIKESGLTALADRRIDKLSGGECRKAFFAMMLCQQARLLLADEPTANLDAEYSKHIIAMLRARKQAGDTVITVLHDINQAFETADRLLVIDDGALVFCGTPREAAAARIPQTLFHLQEIFCTDADGKQFILYK